jgi:membrane-associated phospholipid phosphatase
LANILVPKAATSVERSIFADTSFWAVDKVIMAYFVLSTIIIAVWWSVVPFAWAILALHVAGMSLLVLQVKRPNTTSWMFRNWYPVFYVGYCYQEMAILVPSIRRTNADQWLANADFSIWHANPTVWLERIHFPIVTEIEQTVYSLFIPAVILVAVLLFTRRKYVEFQYYCFLIALGYLLSYIGYILVPAQGPRVLLKDLQHIPLQGLWLFPRLQALLGLDRLEIAHYDCFPSGHTELTLLAWWGSRMVSKRWFQVYFCYTPPLIFATVYLRYHYTVDLMAGAALAFILILATPALYRKLSKGA